MFEYLSFLGFTPKRCDLQRRILTPFLVAGNQRSFLVSLHSLIIMKIPHIRILVCFFMTFRFKITFHN